MKIGIIYCAYNTQEYLKDSLMPWMLARDSHLESNEFLICAVSVPFEKFNEPRLDDTAKNLTHLYENKLIDYVITDNNPIKETEARTSALKYLVSKGADIIWQVDSDEFYQLEEISKIIKFVNSRPFVPSFYGSFKNYVFDLKTYLIEPFTPMRIHRVKTSTYTADLFWDDNNIMYFNVNNQQYLRDVHMTPLAIPKSVQFTKHLTWMSDARGKKKVEYQIARGWNCSFSWNYSKNCLEWNEDFFKKNGQNVPETSTD